LVRPSATPGDDADRVHFEIEGILSYIEIEGGFWGITDLHGNKYIPINLQNEIKITEEKFIKVTKAFKKENQVSTWMWGTLIYCEEWELLDPENQWHKERSLDENQTEIQETIEFPFRLSKLGGLSTLRTFDYESDESNYSLTVRVTDEHNTSYEQTFSVHLINVIEDIDGDGTEDAFDEDTDGDGFSNQTELAQGTNPKDKYSYSNKPILETGEAVFDENGSFILRGSVLENGQGKITDFGFVLSSGISLDREKSTVYWIRGEGDPERFKLNGTESPFEKVMYFRAWAKNVAGYGIGPVKKISIPEAPQRWWGNTKGQSGGWQTSEWFGTFKYYEQGWLYHARLGWLYASAEKENGVWLWKDDRGWLWTNESAWPYLWWNKSKNWLYLVPSKPGERIRFYDYSTDSYR